MTMSDQDNTSKQPYEKPVLRKIELAAEEVLDVGCKTTLGDPASGANICTTNVCFQTGS